jgi:hypothetical protein
MTKPETNDELLLTTGLGLVSGLFAAVMGLAVISTFSIAPGNPLYALGVMLLGAGVGTATALVLTGGNTEPVAVTESGDEPASS